MVTQAAAGTLVVQVCWSSIAKQLREDPKTKDFVSGPFQFKEALNCEGAEKGRALGTITQVTQCFVAYDVELT